MGRKKKRKNQEKKKIGTEWKFGGIWWYDGLALIGLGIYCLAIWWPTRNLPYHWDTGYFVVNAARDLMLRGFSPVVLLEFVTSHPPGFMVMLGLLWKVFGESRLVAHSVMLPVAVMLLFSIYLIGKKLSGRLVGVLAAFLVGFSPMLVHGVGTISVDMVAASLVAASLALWVWGKKVPGILMMTVASIIKTTSLVWIPLLLWWERVNGKDGERKRDDNRRLLLLPVANSLFWFVYHGMVTGWWVVPDGGSILPGNLNQVRLYLAFVAQVVLGWHLRWLMVVLGVVSLVVLWKIKKLDEIKAAWGVLLSALIGIVAFGVKGAFLEESGILIMPFLWLVIVWMTREALVGMSKLSGEWYLVIVAGIIAVASFSQWRPAVERQNEFQLRQLADLNYQDHIRTGKDVAAFLEYVYPNAQIYGGFPEIFQITEPYHGYVTKTLKFLPCSEFEPDNENMQILIMHPYHQSQLACQSLKDKYKFVALQKFESNGKWVQLYFAGEVASVGPEGKKET